jgi:type II secretory pathway pseudopilin PulG
MMQSNTNESGFSFIDVMIAVSILLVGVLALGGAMAAAMLRTNDSEQQLLAKQHCFSTVEAVFSARDLTSLGFEAAQNVSPASGSNTEGIFPNGPQPIRPNVGPDGFVATADDTGTPVSGFVREIVIKPPVGTADPNTEYKTLRQIDVTVYYKVGGAPREQTVTTYMSNYRQVN